MRIYALSLVIFKHKSKKKNVKIIERIELRHIKMDLVSPFVTSMGTEYDEEHIIVSVDAGGVLFSDCLRLTKSLPLIQLK